MEPIGRWSLLLLALLVTEASCRAADPADHQRRIVGRMIWPNGQSDPLIATASFSRQMLIKFPSSGRNPAVEPPPRHLIPPPVNTLPEGIEYPSRILQPPEYSEDFAFQELQERPELFLISPVAKQEEQPSAQPSILLNSFITDGALLPPSPPTIGTTTWNGVDPCTHPQHSWLCENKDRARKQPEDNPQPSNRNPKQLTIPEVTTRQTPTKSVWDGADPCSHPQHSWRCQPAPGRKQTTPTPTTTPAFFIPDASNSNSQALPNRNYLPPIPPPTSYLPPEASVVQPDLDYLPPPPPPRTTPEPPPQSYLPPEAPQVVEPEREYLPPPPPTEAPQVVEPEREYLPPPPPTEPPRDYIPPQAPRVEEPEREYLPPPAPPKEIPAPPEREYLPPPPPTEPPRSYLPPQESRIVEPEREYLPPPPPTQPSQTYLPPEEPRRIQPKNPEREYLPPPPPTEPPQNYLPPEAPKIEPEREYLPPPPPPTEAPRKLELEYLPPPPPQAPVIQPELEYLPPPRTTPPPPTLPPQLYLPPVREIPPEPERNYLPPQPEPVIQPELEYLPPPPVRTTPPPPTLPPQLYLPPVREIPPEPERNYLPPQPEPMIQPELEYLPPPRTTLPPPTLPPQLYLPPVRETPPEPERNYLPPQPEPVIQPELEYLPPPRTTLPPPTLPPQLYLPPVRETPPEPERNYLPPQPEPVIQPELEYLPPTPPPERRTPTLPPTSYLPPEASVVEPEVEYLPPTTVTPPPRDYLPPVPGASANQEVSIRNTPAPAVKKGWDEADSCSHPFHSWLCSKPKARSTGPRALPAPPVQPAQSIEQPSFQAPPAIRGGWDASDPCSHPFHSWMCNNRDRNTLPPAEERIPEASNVGQPVAIFLRTSPPLTVHSHPAGSGSKPAEEDPCALPHNKWRCRQAIASEGPRFGRQSITSAPTDEGVESITWIQNFESKRIRPSVRP